MGSTCTINKKDSTGDNQEIETEVNKDKNEYSGGIVDDQSEAAIEEDIKTERLEAKKKPKFFTDNIVKDVQRLRPLMKIEEILTFRNTYKALCKIMNPIEFESITQEMLESPDDQFIQFEDQVFFRAMLGDYYCYQASKEDDENLMKKIQLKASRFYNDASIISQEWLQPSNSWRLFIGLQLAVFVAFMENNVYTASQIAQETIDSCNKPEESATVLQRSNTTKSKKKLESQDPVISKLKYFINKWEKQLQYMRMETQAANLLQKNQNKDDYDEKKKDKDNNNDDYSDEEGEQYVPEQQQKEQK